jgi:hypothetical protein
MPPEVPTSASSPSSSGPPGEYHREAAVSGARLAAGIEAAAEAWGAAWEREGGRLDLPISAGLHSGRLKGRLRVEPVASGSRLVLTVEARSWRPRTHAVALLVLAAAGGLVTVLWPFFPGLLGLAPMGAVLALSAWFLVISRLTTNSPEDFLALAVELGSEPPGEEVSQPAARSAPRE